MWCLLRPLLNSSGWWWWWRLLVGGGLPGPPVIKQLMQMVTVAPGQGGWFQSVCFPNRLLAHCRNRRTINSVMIFMPLGQGGYPTFKP